MTVIHSPTSDDRVELMDQCFLCSGGIALDDFPDLVEQRLDASLRWLDQQFIVVLTYGLAEKIEPLRYWRRRQPPVYPVPCWR